MTQPRRPDQSFSPPDSSVSPSTAAGTLRARSVIVFGTGAGVGIFVYSPSVGAGNLIGSWAPSAGVDQYGNAYPQGLSDSVGILFGASIAGGALDLNPGPALLYGNPGQIIETFTSGTSWTPQAGVVAGTPVLVETWGAWGGGAGGHSGIHVPGGGGAGAGGYSASVLTGFTAGTPVPYAIGAAGSGGSVPSNGGNGGDTSFNSGAVLAKGGKGGVSGGAGGQGGQASAGTGTTKFSGGNGAACNAATGGGAGSSAGTASAGNNGALNVGGAAVTGGIGAGGAGGPNGFNGTAPGGGGAANQTGAGGQVGQIRFTYTPGGGSADLIVSLSSAAGADAQGNAYPAGIGTASGITALKGGSATVAETWQHVVGGAGFQNGWTDRGGQYPPTAYELRADGDVAINIHAVAGTLTNGTVIWTMPSGYIPAHTQICPLAVDASGALNATTGAPTLLVRGSGEANPGDVQVYNLGTVTTRIHNASARYSLTGT